MIPTVIGFDNKAADLSARRGERKTGDMKNAILKLITAAAFCAMFVFASAADSENIIMPIVGMFICATWLALFSIANER